VIFRNYEGKRFVYKQPRGVAVPGRAPGVAASACGSAAAAEAEVVPIEIGKQAKKSRGQKQRKSAAG
jgi:hypothetical protein